MSIELSSNLSVKFRFVASDYSILVVNCSDSVNNSLSMLLKKIGFKCYSSCNLDNTQKILNEESINYVLLDMDLSNNESEQILHYLEQTNIKIFTLIKKATCQMIDIPHHKNIVDYIIKDEDFFYKIDQINITIERLEKNKHKTILIVSDDIRIRNDLSTILSNRNYVVKLVNNTSDALYIIEHEHIALVLIDLELHDSDAIAFIEQNKNDVIIKNNIPVMVLTEQYNKSIIKSAINAGAIEIFSKSYVDEEVLIKIDLAIDYRRKIEEAQSSKSLLSEYKDAVDESAIVSKSDINGYITFANEQFCKLSGYSEAELVGRNHNIVRDPDMDEKIFRDLWYTIKVAKKSWQGKIKNRKKNGDYYWVDALIKPILDKHGEIIEFIGLRNNITEVEKYKEILKDKLTDSTKCLQDNLSYTTQYEEAISKFTAVMKTDTNNVITFINEEFSKISGYKQEELIGTNCELLRHANHHLAKDSERLSESLSNNEHLSMTFTKIAKDGTFYFVDTVAYPITNSKGEIIEHLHLMHDISELTNLHKEIEDTQKEIVYKMGEIGESRSKETGNHVKRVAEYSKHLALLCGLTQDEANILFTASPMHDIGKIAISDSILKKPGKLTKEEFNIMKTHTTIGFDILKGSSREVLKAASIVANEHHEKWNGQGYPKGLKKEEIHIYGRITAIADVFDALGSDRCYKTAWRDDDIFTFLIEEKGEHFDPTLVTLFLENKDKFIEIRDKYKDI